MITTSLLRTRWAAIGAAVAVTLGAGGLAVVDATVTTGERTVFVAITPCRLVDTRPTSTVGPKSSPVGPGETHTVTAHGTTGDCTIPTDAVALSLNVTAIGASAPTFLAIWPAGATRPDASSLNPGPGQPPTPNAVTTDLSADGRFSIFNLQGSVDVLVDVNGYYADHNHDDRYYTKSEVDTRLPLNDTIGLAGGAFSSAGSDLAFAPDTSCFRSTAPANGLRHSIPIPAGSTITSIGVRAHSTAASSSYTVRLSAIRPGVPDSVTVALGTRTATAWSETSIAVPDEVVDSGEALFVSFSSSSPDSYLCAMTVEFSRPS